MVKYVKISPLARVGGHIGITTRINSDKVSAAYSHGETFRGIEKTLVVGSQGDSNGRDPRDAPVVTSRTSGMDHFTHRHASLRNIESAAGFTFPFAQAADATYSSGKCQDQPGYLYKDTDNTNTYDPLWLGPGRNWRRKLDPLSGLPSGYSSAKKMPEGAQIARNVVQAITTIYSHLVHSVILAGPDYKSLIDNWIVNNHSTDSRLNNCYFSSGEQSSGGFFDNIYKEALVAQRILHEVLGFIGGKSPHQMSAIPGGFSRNFSGPTGVANTDMTYIKTLYSKTIGLGGKTPTGSITEWPLFDLTGGFDQGYDNHFELKGGGSSTGGVDWICKRFAAFVIALGSVLQNIGADGWGYGPNNFICAGAFDVVKVSWPGITKEITGDQYFRSGVYLGNDRDRAKAPVSGRYRYKLDPTTDTPPYNGWMAIYEDIASAKYPEPDQYTEKPVCSGYPGETETQPLVALNNSTEYKYTWCKEARVRDKADPFNLYSVESGPLARLVVNGVDPDLNNSTLTRASLFTDEWKSSTANRLYARLQEMLMLIDMLIGSNYSGENENNTTNYLYEINQNNCFMRRFHRLILNEGGSGGKLNTSSVYVNPPLTWGTLNGQNGCAALEGSSGATYHFCKTENGKLSQYQIVSGSTWNSSGRDSQGNPGPVEWSLMGMKKVEDVSLSQGSSGTWSATLNDPVCERTILIKYELREGPNWKEYTAIDVPKHITDGLTGAEEGQIVGESLKATSKIDYTTGALTLDFKEHSSYDYDYMRNVKVVHYGYADTGVPAPAIWNTVTGYEGYSGDTSEPNPINIMRTVRSFDPCNNCGVH